MALPSTENAATVNAPNLVDAEAQPSTPIPSARTAIESAQIPIPVAITANTPPTDEPPFPLNHARIQWDNVMQVYSTLVDNTGTNTAINALKPNTGERWRFPQTGGSALMRTDFAAPKQWDTVCVGAHNVGSLGGTVRVQYVPAGGGGALIFDDIQPENDDPIMLHSQALISSQSIQITVFGATGTVEVGYVSAGVALQMPRPFFGGHSPINDSDVTRYYHNMSESGNIIGQEIRSQGYQTSAQWNNIPDAWCRTYFGAFKQYAKTNPFFFAWNLLEYPTDVGFVRVNKDINAPYSGTRNLRSISMDLMGY